MIKQNKYDAALKAIQQERRKMRDKRYRESHKDQIREYQARWRAEHPEYKRNYDRRRENKTTDGSRQTKPANA